VNATNTAAVSGTGPLKDNSGTGKPLLHLSGLSAHLSYFDVFTINHKLLPSFKIKFPFLLQSFTKQFLSSVPVATD
jgi:hypothetical protein